MTYNRPFLLATMLLLGVTTFAAAQRNAASPDKIHLPEGFKIELLYTVPRDKQGSWVAMCLDDKNRLIVSDQYGGLYRFAVPAPGKPLDPENIEQITYAVDAPVRKKGRKNTGAAPREASPEEGKLPKIGHAQGICYAFDSLYVVVNSRSSTTGCGVFRLLDTNGDDQFDKVVTIKKLEATGGEHGPHAILPSPDGKNLLVVMGNQTQLPPDYSHSRTPEFWAEDQLLPSLQHFMKGVIAPRGHMAQIDPEGKTWEIIATGFRNQYDAAFNREGELFTFDADMEWDMNTPWYRPTRINHVIDGADYGWRTGSGKFPAHCSDTFGAVVDIGPGSPTGVSFGYGAKFPHRYQNALFVCDWSYGKLYAVHMEEEGSTYRGRFEEFASSQPLPLTDILINPKDGAMYFTIGGRRVQSALYRVTYTGKLSTSPAPAKKANTQGNQQRKQRRVLESHLKKHADPASGKELEHIWQALASPDRGIRHAARAALEKQPPGSWKGLLQQEKQPATATAALIALARADEGKSSRLILEKAMAFDYRNIKAPQHRLDLLRAITLALTRGGMPAKAIRTKLIAWLGSIYPAKSPEENRDLSTITAFLEAPYAVRKTMSLLENAPGQEEQIAYAINLRFIRKGWTADLRRKYFRWFVRAESYQGGARFRNYLNDIKKDALASIPEAQKTPELKKILSSTAKAESAPFTGKPRAFVKMWTMEDLAGLLGAGLEGGRSYKNGRKMFGAGACFACHRFHNEGGAVGPDLTSVAGRFTPHDLLEAIIDPGREISDQYGASIFKLKDGSQVIGRIMNLKEDSYWINTDMMTPSTITKVDVKLIESIEPSPISMMPPGLLSTMEQEDILDLLAYLLSSGNSQDPLFKY
ncbi:MAG: c-type cytochrome [Verrucomicrobiales bacterium]|nr:c-type cytochrome [Verrucomicrobiales bacterium]